MHKNPEDLLEQLLEEREILETKINNLQEDYRIISEEKEELISENENLKFEIETLEDKVDDCLRILDGRYGR